jgi:hypothetical protein
MPAEQLALLPPPEQQPPEPEPRTYWECRGPKDWQPVHVTIRFGNSRGMPAPEFPLVTSSPMAPRNVMVRREDGTTVVKPVRSLRRRHPGGEP